MREPPGADCVPMGDAARIHIPASPRALRSRRLLRLAVETGCRFAIDTDAHAPGQLSWQHFGCERAEECAVPAESVVNTMNVEELLAWSARHG